MKFFGKNRKNRRNKRDHVLDVKAESRQVRAARIRKVSKAIAVTLAVVVLAVGGWQGSNLVLERWVFANPAFRIQSIDVGTDGLIPEKQLLVWSGVSPGENLLALDLAQVQRDLELQPWIEHVAVERLLPGTLRIRVSERKPIARIVGFEPSGGKAGFHLTTFFLDREGHAMLPPKNSHVSAPEGARFDRLPYVSGVSGTEIRTGRRVKSLQMDSALQLVEEFARSPMSGLVDLDVVDLSLPGVLVVKTRQKNEITFALDGFDRQMRHWRLIHDLALREGRQVATLDLSVSNNVPARWQEQEPERPSAAVSRPAVDYRRKHV